MKHSTSTLSFAVIIVGILMGGCGAGGGATKPTNSAPTEGTLGLNKLTPGEQIAKVQNDPQIPAEYKQTYINSVKAKAAAAGGAPK